MNRFVPSLQRLVVKPRRFLADHTGLLAAVCCITLPISSVAGSLPRATCRRRLSAVDTIWSAGIGNWFTPADWSAGIPSPTEVAEINNGGMAQVTTSGATAEDLSLGLAGPDSGTVSVSGAGRLDLNGSVYVGDSGAGTLNITNAAVVTSANAYLGFGAPSSNGTAVVDGEGSQWNISGNLYVGGNASGPAGAGTLRITNGYDPSAIVSASATQVWDSGTIEMGVNAAINGALTFDGGTLRAIASFGLSKYFTIATSGMTIDSNGFDPTLSGLLSGPGTLTKIGSGTLTLYGSNTYIGGTVVTGGRFFVENQNGSATGTGTLNASGSGAIVGGSGVIDSPVIVADGAVLLVGDAKGPADVKTLTLSNDLELDSTLEIQLSFFNTHSTLHRTGGNWKFAVGQKVAFVTYRTAQPGLYSHVITGLAADPGVESWSMIGSGFSGAFTYDGAGNVDLNLTAMPPYLGIESAMLPKTHGAAGVFSVHIPLGGPPAIEPRAGGPGGNHTYVLTFSNPIAKGDVTVGGANSGRLNGAPIINGNTMTVNVKDIAPAAYIVLSVSNVTDIYSQIMEDAYVYVQFREGDATVDDRVDSSDVSQVKFRSGQSVTGSNFLNDLNADGNIDASDISLVKSQSGAASP